MGLKSGASGALSVGLLDGRSASSADEPGTDGLATIVAAPLFPHQSISPSWPFALFVRFVVNPR